MNLLVDGLVRDLKHRIQEGGLSYSDSDLSMMLKTIMGGAGDGLDEQQQFEMGVVAAALELRAEQQNACL